MEYKHNLAIQYDDMLNCLAYIRGEGMTVAWPKPKAPDRDIFDRQ